MRRMELGGSGRGTCEEPEVSEEAHCELIEMFLPELHQAWWAEALAQLRNKKHQALDPGQAVAVGELIREHYKLRHETDLTRGRLRSQSHSRNPLNAPD